MSRPQVIFLGNGALAEAALPVLAEKAEIIFHARSKSDLEQVAKLKEQNPEAFAVLASFGVMIPQALLEKFEPEGIINLHPSLLPRYRGASPIESAILSGDNHFGYSIMKLVSAMDAGPIYHQESFTDLPLNKAQIYRTLAEAGANWIGKNLTKLRTLKPIPQDEDKATYTGKFAKAEDSQLQPTDFTAEELYRQIVAFQGFPKPKYEFFGKNCIILEAKLVTELLDQPSETVKKYRKWVFFTKRRLFLAGKDGNLIEILRLQPEGKRPMEAAGFINGYAKSVL